MSSSSEKPSFVLKDGKQVKYTELYSGGPLGWRLFTYTGEFMRALNQYECEFIDGALTAVDAIASIASQSAPYSYKLFGYVSEHNCTGLYEYQFHKDRTSVYPDNCREIHAVYTRSESTHPSASPDRGPMKTFRNWSNPL